MFASGNETLPTSSIKEGSHGQGFVRIVHLSLHSIILSSGVFFWHKKDALIVYRSNGTSTDGELIDTIGQAMLSMFLVTCVHAGECLGVSGCGDIWDGLVVLISIIRTYDKISM